jgi:hypothetical protein
MAHLKPRTGGSASSHSETSESEEWRTRSHLTLFVNNIPADWMVGELKSFLDRFGHIAKVEIFENREVNFPAFSSHLTIDRKTQRLREGCLQVSAQFVFVDTDYRPAPQTPFWEAAPKMGKIWFGLSFRLAPPMKTGPPLLSKDGSVLPRAVVNHLKDFGSDYVGIALGRCRDREQTL